MKRLFKKPATATAPDSAASRRSNWSGPPAKDDRQRPAANPICGDDCTLYILGSPSSLSISTPVMLVPDINPAAVPANLYEPLKPWQTRLLELSSTAPGRMPSCRLFTVEFIDMQGVGVADTGQIVQYAALSYVWGSSTLDYQITCNGSSLSIYRNLAYALYHLSHSDRKRYLWCDGICIDQKNNTEKAFQVAQILRIFEKAETVIAWMGDLNSDAQLVLKAIMQQDRFTRAYGDCNHRPYCLQGWWRLEDGVALLLKQPIFQRTWIRQEFFAARSLIATYPDIELDFTNFRSCMDHWQNMQPRDFS